MKRNILLVFLLLMGLNSLGLSFFYGLMMSRQVFRVLEEDRRDLTRQVEGRLRILDQMIPLVEQEARRSAERRLRRAYEYLESLDKPPRAWSEEDLAAAGAEAPGIDLYWIDRNLTVQTTSYPADQGLQLGEISDSFRRFLREDVMGRGRIVSQHLTFSNMTGGLNFYSYYSPRGADWILEISRTMGSGQPGWGGDEASFDPRRLFRIVLEENQYLRELDVFSLTRLSSWSLLTGERVRLSPEVQRALWEEGQWREQEGTVVTSYQRIDHVGGSDLFSDQYCLRVVYDYEYYRNRMRRVVFWGLLISAGFLGFFSLLSLLLVDRYLVRHVLRFHRALLQAADGDYTRRLSTGGGIREYREISSAYNQLVKSAEDRRNSLERQKAELLTAVHQRDVLMAEVHHRVKNNLQIITSLISLENEKMDSAGQRVLQQISGRVSAMSAVHEILYGAENAAYLSLDELVRRVMDAVSDVYYDCRVILRLEVAIQQGGVSLDAAIPLALILSEALINAIIHGVEPGEELPFRVSSEVSGDRWILSLEDWGCGFPAEGGYETGFGFILMKSLSEQLGGTFRTYSREGAVVELELPAHLLEGRL